MSENKGTMVSLRDFIDQRFDSLEKTLSDHCDAELARETDQENRLRTLERRQPWRNVIEIITGLGAAIAVALGLKQ